MADIEQRFIVYVLTPSGDDAFDFEMTYEISNHEKTIIESIEESGTSLIDNEELAILYRQLEKQADEMAIQKFWDRNSDAPDEAFNDYQIIIDI